MSNEHKGCLDEIVKGDTIITATSTGHGMRYSKVVVTKVTPTQVTVGTEYTVTYRRKDGQRVGDKDGRTVAYAPNQVINPWSAEKETALQRLEAAAAKQAALIARNNNIRFIENNMRSASDELLAQVVAMMTAEKAKKDAEFEASRQP